MASALQVRCLADPEGRLAAGLAHIDGCDAADLGLLADRARLEAARRFLAQGGHAHGLSGGKLAAGGGVPLTVTESDADAACQGYVAASMRSVAQAGGHGGERGAPAGWDSVGGLEEAVAAVQDALELAALAAGWAEAAPLRLRTGLLLYGPPGCGKTHLVRPAPRDGHHCAFPAPPLLACEPRLPACLPGCPASQPSCS